jgi:hypothetical protein
MARPGGNPKIATAGESTRWKAAQEGQETVALGVRSFKSQLEQLDTLPGTRSEHIRAAIADYLAKRIELISE